MYKKHDHMAGRTPSTKTPPDKVAIIRSEFLAGDRVTVIASRNGVSPGLVTRYCSDLSREGKQKPLIAAEIDRLFQSWGAV